MVIDHCPPSIRSWRAAGGGFYGEASADYPLAPGRMIALKADPIWVRINRFKTPWPPLDWGSGMGFRNVRRGEALELGLIQPGDPDQVNADAPFNAELKMSVRGLPMASRERLRSEFGDSMRIDNETILNQRDTTDANEYRGQTIREELRERARAIADKGRREIARLRSRDGSATGAPGNERGTNESELLASTSAVATGRKLLYHEQWGSEAEDYGKLIRRWLPAHVKVTIRNGHVNAWMVIDHCPPSIRSSF